MYFLSVGSNTAQVLFLWLFVCFFFKYCFFSFLLHLHMNSKYDLKNTLASQIREKGYILQKRKGLVCDFCVTFVLSDRHICKSIFELRGYIIK